MTGTSPKGLSQVVRHGKLRHRTNVGVRRFATTRFDDELLSVVDAAAAAGLPLALVIPLPAAQTPVVLGAASLVSEIVREGRADVATTVVSKRLTQRADYDQLYIGDQRLAELIPRARLAPSGTLEVIGKARHDAGGRMVLTSDPVRVASSGGGLVIDGTGADPGDLRGLLREDRALVYVTDNPFDTTLEIVRDAGGVVWAFDPQALARLSAVSDTYHGHGGDALAASSALLTAAGDARRVVWTPDAGSPLDGALRAAWTALGRLAATETRAVEYDAAQALRWAWGTLATYGLLATTPECYDRHVTPGPYTTKLSDAAGHARAVAGNRSGAARDAWGSVAEAFAALHEAAGAATKLPLMQRWLDGLADDGRTGLLVTRNRTAASAVTSALQESTGTRHGWLDHARVVSARDVRCGRVERVPVDSMLLTGPLPRAYASLAAAPPANEVLIAVAGPWEAARAARQIAGTVRALCDLRAETRTGTAPRLGLRAGSWFEETVGDVVTVRRDGVELALSDLPTQEDSPWAPFHLDVLAVIAGGIRGLDDATDIAPPARSVNGGVSAGVEAITVIFSDGRYLLVEPNDLLYRRRGEEAGRVAAKSLINGDVVALVDSAARRDLFDTVVDVLSELPKYALLATLGAFWQQRLAKVRARGLTLREILASMRAGPDPTQITTEGAIGHWFRGLVAGPVDQADVRRFAVAVGDRELTRRAEAVGAALHTSRVLNRAVGRWLSAQITGARLRDDDTVVDPELGVNVADLLEAVTLHQVTAVQVRTRTVPASAVGLLHSAPLPQDPQGVVLSATVTG